MSNLPPDSKYSKIDEAIDDFKRRHKADNLQQGTPEWEAAVATAIEKHQLHQERSDFVERLGKELPKKADGCIRDGKLTKCNQGPWVGVKCTLCGKTGKLGAPDKDVAAIR
ncbi:hypothetical protein [Noviherbaspirillum autotrophicum]|uniref:Uncharacterized protein n=1 Tax=Noviherbaspirillum autotrophicum TaxID=709839 RepID=A0A0C2BP41_9BURK|nr:hypothetical protein [Noviherbaspirillum autotrophicum]KIF83045.1 hypothetical protein TSA66_22955 [Noviherbaspirillum autotrophicum]